MRKASVPVVGFVAPSGSGKTSLLRKLVPVLTKRGLRVGYLKHAHHTFDLDVPGKDSYEIRAAGAKQTLLASRERWAMQSESADKSEDPPLEEMLARFETERLDLILVEGFKHSNYPKIEVHRAATGKPLLYPEDREVIAVVTDERLPGEEHPPELPLNDPEAIADFVQQQTATGSRDNEKLREELLRHYRWLRRYGHNDSHSGNASVRAGDTFWITPTGACADTLQTDALVACGMDEPLPEAASMDAPVHRRVYLTRPEAKAVLHSHGPHSVAMSFAGQDFRPVDVEGRTYFESVPVVSVDYEKELERAPEILARALAEHRIAMVRGHGVYAWGDSLDQAYKWICSLELSARIYVIAKWVADI